MRRGSFHGNDLTEALGSPRDGCPGLTDSCAGADRMLRLAEGARWITRGIYAPTRVQLFFGVGGAPGHLLARERTPGPSDLGSAAVLYHWITNWDVWCAAEQSYQLGTDW